MRTVRLTALLLVAVALALIAGGCGDEGPQIPRDQAQEIVRRLQEADRRVSEDPPVCGDLEDDTLPELEDQVAGLPEETDDGIKETLKDGIDHLRTLIEAVCAARPEEPEPTETTEPPPTTTTEPQPPPEEEEGEEEEPQPTEPTPTTPTPTTPTTPDPGSGGQGVPEEGE